MDVRGPTRLLVDDLCQCSSYVANSDLIVVAKAHFLQLFASANIQNARNIPGDFDADHRFLSLFAVSQYRYPAVLAFVVFLRCSQTGSYRLES